MSAIKALSLLFLLALAFGLSLRHDGAASTPPSSADIYAQLFAGAKANEKAQEKVD
jgi:hypothetical protein